MKKTEVFNIENAIRKEIYTSPSNNKQTVYVFNCLKCNTEFKKTAYYAKNCTGYCKFCAPKIVHNKPKIIEIEKICRICKNLKEIDNFSVRESGHRRTECSSCINLKRIFDLNSNDFNRMLKEQDNGCGICGKEETSQDQNGKIRKLSVDHCHKTGKIRGLLCSNCNVGIGHFKDKKELLIKAIEYLEKNHDN